MKKSVGIILSVILIGIAIWGGIKYKQYKDFQREMVEIVHSKEVEKLVVTKLKKLDKNALTKEGKIHSYKIDDSTIRHNPMGGIMFDIYINDDKDIIGKMGLVKYGENSSIESIGLDKSVEFQELLESSK